MRKKGYSITFVVMCLLAGCTNSTNNSDNTITVMENAYVNDEENNLDKDYESNLNRDDFDGIDDCTETNDTPGIDISPDISPFGDFSEEWIVSSLDEIRLTVDSHVDFVRFVGEGHSCLQIGIAYDKVPENTWHDHKEDYFIFEDGTPILYVDYNDIATGGDRIVFAEPTFEAHFEDVTFDGQDELVVYRGVNGMSGMKMYSAYEYIDGEYEFFPAFEWLYTYTVDSTNETIACFRTSGDSRNIEYTSVYKYENGEYVLVDEYAEQDGVRVDSHF
jgi:hypothetical protein